jgi:hypothetical protein
MRDENRRDESTAPDKLQVSQAFLPFLDDLNEELTATRCLVIMKTNEQNLKPTI